MPILVVGYIIETLYEVKRYKSTRNEWQNIKYAPTKTVSKEGTMTQLMQATGPKRGSQPIVIALGPSPCAEPQILYQTQ